MYIIEHKCPCCGYETKNKERTDEHRKPFILIDSDNEFVSSFCTDVPQEDSPYVHKRVYLLGCPKCNSVSFKFEI